MKKNPQTEEQVVPWGLSIRQGLRIALMCAFLCFVVRCAWSWHVRNVPLVGDQIFYAQSANALAAGEGYAFKGELTAGKSPGYSFLISLVWRLFGESRIALLLVQSLLAAFGCGVTVILALRVTRKRAVALLAGLAVAFYLPMAMSDCMVLSEALFGPLALISVLLLDGAFRSGKFWLCVLAGLGTGLAAYVRAEVVVLPLVFLVVLLCRRVSAARAFACFAVIGVVVFASLLPWGLRNRSVFGVFTPFPSSGGLSFAANWNANSRHSSLLIAPYWQSELLNSIKGKNEYEVDRILKQWAVKEIKADPAQYAKSIVLKSIRQWTNLFNITSPSKATLVLAVVNTVVVAFAIPALWRRRIDSLFRGYALGCIIYVTALAGLMTSGEPRYAFWVWPLIFIMAADSLCRAHGGQLSNSG